MSSTISPNYQSSLEQIKADIYFVLIKAWQEYVSKKGTKCIRWSLAIIEGDFIGRPLVLTLPFEGKGAGFLRDFLQCIDETYVDGDFQPDNFLNKKIYIKVLDTKALQGDRSYLKIVPLRNYDLTVNPAPIFHDTTALTDVGGSNES